MLEELQTTPKSEAEQAEIETARFRAASDFALLYIEKAPRDYAELVDMMEHFGVPQMTSPALAQKGYFGAADVLRTERDTFHRIRTSRELRLELTEAGREYIEQMDEAHKQSLLDVIGGIAEVEAATIGVRAMAGRAIHQLLTTSYIDH